MPHQPTSVRPTCHLSRFLSSQLASDVQTGNGATTHNTISVTVFRLLRSLAFLGLVSTFLLAGFVQTAHAQSRAARGMPAQDKAAAACSLNEQTRAMLPAFRSDVNRERGIPVYNLTFKSDVTSLTSTGHEEICYTNRTGGTLTDLVMRLYSNRMGGALSINNLKVAGRTATWQTTTADSSYIRVLLPSPLKAGSQAIISLEYSGRFANKTGPAPDNGFVDGRQAFIDGVLALGNFYPQVGVWERGKGWNTLYMDPSVTDPTYADASFFNVTFTVPATEKVLVSGVEVQTKQNSDGTTTHRFVTGPVREFAMVMSAKYAILTQQADGITFRSAYVPDQQGSARAYAQKALQAGIAAVQSYSHFFGPYPYAKIDYAETNMTFGGIEQPTLIELTKLLYQNAVTTPGGQGMSNFDFVTSHETGHMWWYNMVGDNQQGHTWIDEGTTNYSTFIQYELYARLKGASSQTIAAIRKSFETELLHETVLAYNQLGHDVVVDRPANQFHVGVGRLVVEIVANYAPYLKTPTMYLLYREKYGDKALFSYFRNLFNDYKYKIAQPEDILAELQKAAPGHNAQIAAFFQRWLKQAQLGNDIDTRLNFKPAPAWYSQVPRYPRTQNFDIPRGALALFGDPTQIFIEASLVSDKPADVLKFYIQKLTAAGWQVQSSNGDIQAVKGKQVFTAALIPGSLWPDIRPDLANKVKPNQSILVLEASDQPISAKLTKN